MTHMPVDRSRTGTATSPVAAHDWELWSTRGRLVVTEPRALAPALALVLDLLDEVERAASRFRPDSEVLTLTPGPDGTSPVSPMLADLLTEAIAAARATGGAVDPTVGAALCDLGYDRDIGLVLDGDRARAVLRPVPGWRRLRLDGSRLSAPAGVCLDLGATAKAVAADRCAARVAERLGTGVLVSLGGDIATAGGAPSGGWQVTVQDTDADPAAHVGLPAGWALATSSTVRRTWRRSGETVHHIVDPGTSQPASSPWRSVSVAAPTCVRANAAATATLVKGARGRDWLHGQGLAARLVRTDGDVVLLHGWPEEVSA